MAERRSLGDAMLTPEKLAFIHSGAPAAEPAKPQVKAVPAKPVPQEDVVITDTAEESEPAPVAAARPRARSRSRRPALQPVTNYGDFQGLANLLVPLTTRLQPSTSAALRRAGLEQRLRGQEPATVQEIAEEAIAKWLRDAGYLE